MFSATLLLAWMMTVPPPEDVSRILQKQSQELLDAVTYGKPEVWDAYLHERATITAENGKVYTKAEMVKEIRPLPEGVSGSIKVIDFNAIVHGPVAVTNYVADEDEVYHGHELHCQYRVTDTWLKTADGWKLIAAQLLALRTDPPAIALSKEQMDGYAGQYALTPAITYEIRRNDAKLEGQRNGRPAEALMAEAVDVFFVPGNPRYRKIFQRDASGKITGFVERREAWDLVWTRVR